MLTLHFQKFKVNTSLTLCQSHLNAKETLWNQLMQQENLYSCSRKPNFKYALVKIDNENTPSKQTPPNSLKFSDLIKTHATQILITI